MILFCGASWLCGQSWVNGGSNTNYLKPDNLTAQVGVGVAAPLAKFHVSGNGNISGVFENGKVGIGIQIPIDELHISRTHNERTWIRIENNNTGSLARTGISIGGYNPNWNGFVHVYNSPNFVGGGAIGTSWQNKAVTYTGANTAGYELHLGSATQSLTFSRNNSGTRQVDMIIDGQGRMGVGTGTPGGKLHVNGDFVVTDGTQGAGYIMSCDAAGRTSWVNPSTITGGGSNACITTSLVPNTNLCIATSQVLETGSNGNGDGMSGNRLFIGSEGADQPLSWGAYPVSGVGYKHLTGNSWAGQINYQPYNNKMKFNFTADPSGASASTASFYTGMLIDGGNGSAGSHVKVRIGEEENSAHTDAHLQVNGKAVARAIVVTDLNWADFVFEDDYELRSLEEVESFIDENGHLPDMPSEAQVDEEGVSLGEMDAKLLQKVEEITLYLLEMEKENAALKVRLAELETQVTNK